MDFSSWLTEKLAEREWTMARLAAALGITAPSVKKWLKGETIPHPNHIPALARLFGVPEAELRRFYPFFDLEPPPADWRDLRIRELFSLEDDFAATITADDLVEFRSWLQTLGGPMLKKIHTDNLKLQQAAIAARPRRRDRPASTPRSVASPTAATVSRLDQEQSRPRERVNGSA